MLRIFQSWTFVFSSVPNELSYWLACRRDSFLLTINPEKFFYNLDWYLVSQNFAWKLRLGGSRLGWMLLLQFSLFRLWISSRRVKGGDKGTEGKETSFDHTCNDATWFRNIQWKTIRRDSLLLLQHCWIFTRNSLYWEMLLVQVWTLGDNWLWLWQLIASLMLGCIATLLLLLYSSTGRNISSTLCPKRMEIDYYREWNSKVASTTESGAKDYYWILGLFQGKKQKCCSDGRRIDTNVHLGRG